MFRTAVIAIAALVAALVAVPAAEARQLAQCTGKPSLRGDTNGALCHPVSPHQPPLCLPDNSGLPEGVTGICHGRRH